jgi:hypothetical protein
VLLAHRHLPTDALVPAMRQATDAGVTEAAVVLVEARRIADRQPAARVIPIGALHRFDRPTPVLAGYDSLLDQPAAQQAGGHNQPDQRTADANKPAGHQPDLEVVGAEVGEVAG